MPRRMEVELTSARDDGTWTWRAAGAKQPKGVLDGGLLPAGAHVGDVVKAEVEVSLDGVEITAISSGGRERHEPERLELVARQRDEPLVTSTLVPKGRGARRDRDRPDRPAGRGSQRRPGDRPRREHSRDGSEKRPDPRGGGGDRKPSPPREGKPGEERRERRPRKVRSFAPAAPRAKRLRPARAHRKALVASLPPEQQPVAEQLLLGGLPAVRQALTKQNEQATAEGRPEVGGQELLRLAEDLAPRLRVAEWRDRAEAALAEVDELDLRDLRSVVVASSDNARDDETRAIAETLREALTRRVESAQGDWLTEIAGALDEGRVVRALHLSSRPPKAGAPFPPDLAARLIDATEASLTPDASGERWAVVLDALSFSPVRLRVAPKELPAEPGAELREVLPKLAARLPDLAARFGVTAPSGRAAKPPRGPAGAASTGSRPAIPKPPPPPNAEERPPRVEPEPDAPAAELPAGPRSEDNAEPSADAESSTRPPADPERPGEPPADAEPPGEPPADAEPGETPPAGSEPA